MTDAADRPAPTIDAVRGLQDAMHEATLAVARSMRMNATDAAAVEFIALSGGRAGPTELGARLGITRSSATEVVQRLVASGHLERHRDDIDRRRYRLVPTPAATDAVGHHLTPLRSRLEGLASSFTADERAAIERYLRGAADVFREVARDDDV